jgi:hypothetical protein
LGRPSTSRLVNEHEVRSHLDSKENGVPLTSIQVAEPRG